MMSVSVWSHHEVWVTVTVTQICENGKYTTSTGVFWGFEGWYGVIEVGEHDSDIRWAQNEV